MVVSSWACQSKEEGKLTIFHTLQLLPARHRKLLGLKASTGMEKKVGCDFVSMHTTVW